VALLEFRRSECRPPGGGILKLEPYRGVVVRDRYMQDNEWWVMSIKLIGWIKAGPLESNRSMAGIGWDRVIDKWRVRG
jgi:hypothetical protein